MEPEHKRDRLGLWNTEEESEPSGLLSGYERLHNKRFNKGLAFTHKERQALGIHGLLPPYVKTGAEQIEHVLLEFDHLDNNLDRFVFLSNLAEHNERLFYNVLAADLGKLLPIVYTPVVNLGCEKFSFHFRTPKGLFITIKDKGHIYSVLRNWPIADVRAIVVTNGESILGLGDLGANGMGMAVSKTYLHTIAAGIKPYHCIPITLDVGTNNQSFLNDPLYIGIREKRVSSKLLYELVNEFLQAVVGHFGQNCLIQFGDFGNDTAMKILEKYQDKYCLWNGDIQCTGGIVLAGILTTMKMKNSFLKDNRILLFGAGLAAIGIANICVMAMKQEGLNDEDAKQRIWLMDSKGLVTKNRSSGGLTEYELIYAHDHPEVNTLAEAVDIVKPTILIGASGVGGAFTKAILKKMAEFCETPVIFALSSCTAKSECTAVQAYVNTKGKCIFAAGSSFYQVEYEDKTFYPSQVLNCFLFPGISMGVICSGMLTIPEDLFLIAAGRLSELCTEDDLANGRVYPHISKLTQCSLEIAVSIVEYAYKKGLATFKPEPKNKRNFIQSQMYKSRYPPAIPDIFHWNN